ncbi:MAG: TIGR01777 family oxidoreductase [Fulvivirga sp.]
MNKMVIAAGTGYLGRVLIKHFKSKVNEVIILARGAHSDYDNVKFIQWDAINLGHWTTSLEGADALINLTGKSVDCRYNEGNKALIYSSRLLSTEILGRAISKCINPPKVWVNASSATIYRHSLDKQMDEEDGEIGEGFSVDVCQKWEAAFNQAKTPFTNKITARIGIVLGKEGGAFIPLKKIVKCGLGGNMGKGNQYFSWIHEDDFASVIEHFITNNRMGIYNVTAPSPIRNKDLMRLLRDKLGVNIGLHNPKFLLEIGAFLMSTETELLLKSRNVIPARLLNEGFTFKYNKLEQALDNLIR